jgi:transposase
VVKFGEFIMILELHRQGLKVAAIARQLGIDRKTVRKYISRGLEPPTYGPRPRRQKSTDPYLSYLRERLAAFPGLTAVRLWREMRERGYTGVNGTLNLTRACRYRHCEPDPSASSPCPARENNVVRCFPLGPSLCWVAP